MKTKKCLTIGIITLVLLTFFSAVCFAADPITIKGKINDDNQLVTEDETIYTIADNDQGSALMELVGEQVIVTGTVEEDDGEKIITVISYEVVTE